MKNILQNKQNLGMLKGRKINKESKVDTIKCLKEALPKAPGALLAAWLCFGHKGRSVFFFLNVCLFMTAPGLCCCWSFL